MRDLTNATPRWRCAAHGNRLREAVSWYCIHGRLHISDQIAMAADAQAAYHADAGPPRTRC